MHDTLYLMYYTVDTVRISLQSRYGADTVPDTMGMAAMGMAAGPPMRTTTTPTPHRQATTSPRRHRCNRAPPAEPCVISRPRAAPGCVGGGDRPGWARVGVETVIGGVHDGHGRHCDRRHHHGGTTATGHHRPSHVYSADPGQLLGAWGVGIGRGGPGWVREAMDRPAKRATCPTMHAWLWSQNGDKIYYYTSTRSTCQKGW